MLKYTRKQINLKAHLHGKSFVLYKEVEEVMTMLVKAAIEAGADEDKLMEFFSDDK